MYKKKFNKENIYIINGKTLIKIIGLVRDMKSLTLSQAEMDGYGVDELYYITKVFDDLLDNLFATKNFSELKLDNVLKKTKTNISLDDIMKNVGLKFEE
tara:strand:+ start:635 stop:931 length:297 start_codon:yes stop_codon:yes gene_type:complete